MTSREKALLGIAMCLLGIGFAVIDIVAGQPAFAERWPAFLWTAFSIAKALALIICGASLLVSRRTA